MNGYPFRLIKGSIQRCQNKSPRHRRKKNYLRLSEFVANTLQVLAFKKNSDAFRFCFPCYIMSYVTQRASLYNVGNTSVSCGAVWNTETG